ncbi:DUF4397 domain-containing protein [Luteirhabdus pelagi]|uniref:DUF4397 domain-containing protein n=1 Tax=Luteirhabdus pelagi TaxID=2792783 RepID=UPI00193A1B38|nr:DUF4397 domain-containing protein [Luteirhabdus pelagi]
MKKLLLIVMICLISSAVVAQTARVQVIHNSADAAATEVDVYIDTDLALDDFEFRTATEFLDLPAEVEIELSVAPGNSTDVGDALLTVPVTLADGETYIVVADGIVSGSGYNPAPPLTLQVYPMGREAATNGSNTDVLVHHGSTDAPTVDVVETGVGAGTIVDDISYSEFQGYLELPTDDYVVEVRDETGTTGVAAYSAPLATLNLDGAALTVLASGFLDPSENSDGPAFGLFAATAAGGPLLALPSAPLNIESFVAANLEMYPNPATNYITIANVQRPLKYAIIDMQGRMLQEQAILNSNQEIDIARLSQGVYQILFYDNTDLIGSKKFIKQ